MKAVIFDFDGTLADTASGILATFKETFRQMGLKIPSDTELKSTIGLTLFEAFSTLPGIDSKEMAEEAVDLYRKVYRSIAFPIIKVFEGIPELLSQLKSKGLILAVATSRSHLSLEDLALKIGILQYFDVLRGAEDVSHHKPHPEMVINLLKDINVKSDEAIVVGDATYDLLMGRNAGCRVCGVSWGNQSRETLEGVTPDFVADNVEELKNWFNCL